MSTQLPSSTVLLSIDTATEACSVCLVANGQYYSRFEPTPRQHSQKILPLIESVLDEAGLSKRDIDYVAFGRGPGSFTGVRIAVSIAQGLAFGLGVPLIPISNTKAMAEQAFAADPNLGSVLVAIDARMNEVYFAGYKRTPGEMGDSIEEVLAERVIAPASINQDELGSVKWKAVGTGWQLLDQFDSSIQQKLEGIEDTMLPRAESIARLAMPIIEAGENSGKFPAIEDCVPVYLRNDVAWKKVDQQK